MSRMLVFMTLGSIAIMGVYMMLGAPTGDDRYKSVPAKTFTSPDNPNKKKTFNDVLKEAAGIK